MQALNNEKAQNAFNQILSSALKFKNLKILNPFDHNKNITEKTVSDLTIAENLFQKDLSLPPAQRRVHRVFKGSNDAYTHNYSLSLGDRILRFSASASYSENHVEAINEQEQKTKNQ